MFVLRKQSEVALPTGRVRRVFQFHRQRTYQINLKFSRSRTLERSTLFLLIDAYASVRRHAGKSGQKQFDYLLEHVMTPLENALKTMPIFLTASRAAVEPYPDAFFLHSQSYSSDDREIPDGYCWKNFLKNLLLKLCLYQQCHRMPYYAISITRINKTRQIIFSEFHFKRDIRDLNMIHLKPVAVHFYEFLFFLIKIE